MQTPQSVTFPAWELFANRKTPVRCLRLLTSLFVLAALVAGGAGNGALAAEDQPRKYLRFAFEGETYYGFLIGDRIFELDGDFLHGAQETGRSIPLAGVELLLPVEPSKIFGIALNYASHGGSGADHNLSAGEQIKQV